MIVPAMRRYDQRERAAMTLSKHCMTSFAAMGVLLASPAEAACDPLPDPVAPSAVEADDPQTEGEPVADPVGATTAGTAFDAVAKPNTPDYSAHLLGDVGGIRSGLDAIGVTYNLLYVNQAATNVRGGVRHDLAYADMFWLSGTADLEKMAGIAGASFHASFTKRGGEDLRATAGLNANLLVNEVFGQGSIYRFNYAYWEQSLFSDRLDVKVGRLSGSFEFFPFPCNFQNLTFCAAIPAYMTPNWTPFPGYTYGIVPRVNLAKNLYVQAGIYQIDSRYKQEGRAWSLGPIFRGEGSRKNIEAGWSPALGGKAGHYRAGIFFDNVGADDVARDIEGSYAAVTGRPLLRHDHQFGYYVMADQDIWADSSSPDRKLTIFANVVRADRNVARLRDIAEAGFFWKGPFIARPQDDISFAFGRVQTNKSLTEADEALRASGGSFRAARRYEYPVEFYYSLHALKPIIVQPNVQYVINPGGRQDNRDEMVLGLKSVIIF
jgi:porin